MADIHLYVRVYSKCDVRREIYIYLCFFVFFLQSWNTVFALPNDFIGVLWEKGFFLFFFFW